MSVGVLVGDGVSTIGPSPPSGVLTCSGVDVRVVVGVDVCGGPIIRLPPPDNAPSGVRVGVGGMAVDVGVGVTLGNSGVCVGITVGEGVRTSRNVLTADGVIRTVVSLFPSEPADVTAVDVRIILMPSRGVGLSVGELLPIVGVGTKARVWSGCGLWNRKQEVERCGTSGRLVVQRFCIDG